MERGRTTKSAGVHDSAPHQDKVFDVPEAPNGLPDNFFESAAFFDVGMQREAKRLNNTKSKVRTPGRATAVFCAAPLIRFAR